MYVGSSKNLKDLKERRGDYWKGEVFAYGGSIQTLKDLKGTNQCCRELFLGNGNTA